MGFRLVGAPEEYKRGGYRELANREFASRELNGDVHGTRLLVRVNNGVEVPLGGKDAL
jgi:hypothetical protein